MRITESKLRSVIKQIIKEYYEDPPAGSDMSPEELRHHADSGYQGLQGSSSSSTKKVFRIKDVPRDQYQAAKRGNFDDVDQKYRVQLMHHFDVNPEHYYREKRFY